jgi:hypothetical protein
LWVGLQLQIGKVSALIYTRAQFSCIQEDEAEFDKLMGEPCFFKECSVVCSLADGRKCVVANTVNMHVKLLSFSWNQEFKILHGRPVSVILGLDFLQHTKMVVDVASRKYYFAFAPSQIGSFILPEGEGEEEPYLVKLRQ